MGGVDKSQIIKKARSLEKSGQLRKAYDTYLSADGFQDAARLLASAGKPGDAGRLILHYLKINPDKVDRLVGNERKYAYLAATYLAKAEDMTSLALTIFMALGERNRAADLLEKQGDFVLAAQVRDGKPITRVSENIPRRSHPAHPARNVEATKHTAVRLEQEGKHDAAVSAYIQLKLHGEAARLLRSLGRYGEAAGLYAQAGMAYEAGVCYLEVGDTENGLNNLTKVRRTDPHYRTAAAEAIQVARKQNLLNFQLEHFLADFVAQGPANSAEFDVFCLLGELYETQGLLENAKETLQKILTLDPGEPRATSLLQSLSSKTEIPAQVYERIRHQDESYIGKPGQTGPAPRPDGPSVLPKLPDLPSLPPPPRITGLDLSPEGLPIQSATPQSPLSDHQAQVAETLSIQGASNPPYADMSETDRKQGGGGSPDSDIDFAVGNVIADRYRLIGELGRGGMAAVYEAYDLELDEDIALKVFLQQVTDPQIQRESLARFRQELKLSRQLLHPNIIRLYDIGLHLGHRYISMELLRGAVLEDLLGQPLEFARGLAYLVQICQGLHAAHEKGVVHRDIKPDNLFVTETEMVKVMDFGIAKNTHVRGLTMEGMTAGTPEYIAPEQINDFSNVTAAADQYALGLIAYRMFTGTLPFQHEELSPLLVMHLHHVPQPPQELNPEIPDVLNGMILRLLEKRPESRFTSCLELASHLKKLQLNYKRV